jgi:hypothetical protein
MKYILIQRVVVVRQVPMGNHPQPVARNVQAVIGTWYRTVCSLHNKIETL